MGDGFVFFCRHPLRATAAGGGAPNVTVFSAAGQVPPDRLLASSLRQQKNFTTELRGGRPTYPLTAEGQGRHLVAGAAGYGGCRGGPNVTFFSGRAEGRAAQTAFFAFPDQLIGGSRIGAGSAIQCLAGNLVAHVRDRRPTQLRGHRGPSEAIRR